MKIEKFADYLNQIERISSRNEMTQVLCAMLKEASAEEIGAVVYLSLGSIGPLFERINFGISTKLMLRGISEGFKIEESMVASDYNKIGDLGDLVYSLKKKQNNANFGKGLSVLQTFKQLMALSAYAGKGSQKDKSDYLSAMLVALERVSAKYIVRIILGKLRLGFSDMTIIDALSFMLAGDKSLRKEIENSYSISADIGKIAILAKTVGIKGLNKIKVTVGTPVRPAAAERLPGANEIIEKLGSVAAEPKIDGFRIQAHFDQKKGVRLFSRNLENMTDMFPEVTIGVKNIKVDSIIFEGEAVAYKPESEEFLPFQETVSRRRKYDIEEKSQSSPLRLFAFDLLYLNGESYLEKPYTERRKKLTEVLANSAGAVMFIEEQDFHDGASLGKFFLEQIEHGLEGILAKRLDAPYTPGKRNFNWVKLKREEKSELNDSIDCVVMGYKFGKGKRNQFGIGAFLAGVYEQESDTYKTICNVGTGLSDDQWREMKKMVDENKSNSKPALYDVPKGLDQDVWAKPGIVVEVRADEITRSPVHTAGKEDGVPGYALRFPRLIKWRDDKKPQDSTSVSEVISLFKQQRKK
jgi:DNA ligase-1